MAYIVIQGSKGFVSLVEKARVQQPDGSSKVQTIRGICGLGNMDREEYIKYRVWAHSFKDQEERKAMVLSSGRAIEIKETAVKAVTADKQAKTTVKRPPKTKQVISKSEKQKEHIRKHKKWFATLTDKQQKSYREMLRNHREMIRKELLLDQKELQEKFRKISKKGIKSNDQPMYKIDDLVKVQEYEAEIKTLKGSDISRARLRQGVIEREKKIMDILGDKYKTGKEVAIAVNKGDVIIVDR